MTEPLAGLTAELIDCRRCPRLVGWREQIASERRAAYAGETYWGRPVPGFGDPDARLVIVGLAPGAHGANRTGRMFTGDSSGDWLFRALHRTGFASQAESIGRDDGLQLRDVWVTGAVRCVPPDNRPTPRERDACGTWLDSEMALLTRTRIVLCLGHFSYQSVWRSLARRGVSLPRPRPAFAHGRFIECGHLVVSTSYHPSRQNTATGKLTEQMLDGVLEDIRHALEAGSAHEGTP